MGYGSGRALARAGLLNAECADIGELASGRNKDSRGTWCAASCGLSHYSGLQIVFVGGEYKNKCPACGGTSLYHDRISPARNAYMKTQARRFIEFETKRKAGKR